MRFILDIENEELARSIKVMMLQHEEEGTLKFVDMGDPIEHGREQLRKIKEAVEMFQSAGINEDVMVAFIKMKTRLPTSVVRKVIRGQREFFEGIGINER